MELSIPFLGRTLLLAGPNPPPVSNTYDLSADFGYSSIVTTVWTSLLVSKFWFVYAYDMILNERNSDAVLFLAWHSFPLKRQNQARCISNFEKCCDILNDFVQTNSPEATLLPILELDPVCHPLLILLIYQCSKGAQMSVILNFIVSKTLSIHFSDIFDFVEFSFQNRGTKSFFHTSIVLDALSALSSFNICPDIDSRVSSLRSKFLSV